MAAPAAKTRGNATPKTIQRRAAKNGGEWGIKDLGFREARNAKANRDRKNGEALRSKSEL
jgi:hypothetical protein